CFDTEAWYLLCVLVGNTLTALFVSAGILSGPPVLEVAFRIELTPLVIEAMRDLVSNDGSNRAVVRILRQHGFKIRRLQNSGGEVDGVQLPIVVGIHRGWSHSPLHAIYRLANLVQLPLEFERCRLMNIIDEAGRR